MKNALLCVECPRHEHPGAEDRYSIALFTLKKLAPVPFRHAPLWIVRGGGADGYLVSLRGKVFAAPGVDGGDSGFVGPVIDAENKYAQCRALSFQVLTAASE